MQSQDNSNIIEQVEPPKSPRRRWLVPVLAGAGPVIIAIVVGVALLSGDNEPDVTNEAPVPTKVASGQEGAASLIGTHGKPTGGLVSSRPDLIHFNLDGTFQIELDGDIIDSGTYVTEGDLISFVSQPSEPVWQYNPCTGSGGDCNRGTHDCEDFAGEYRVVFEGTTRFTFEVVHDECPPRLAVASGLEMDWLIGDLDQ